MSRKFEIPDTALGIGKRVFLRRPLPEDQREFTDNIIRSRNFHQPWIVNSASPTFFASYLLRFEHNSKGHLVCDNATGVMLGVININDIMKGALQCGFLGFYAFIQHAGQGYMSEGLQLVLERGFNQLNLHRLEANIQPRNMASRNFVKRHGFKQEGFSRRYLKIAGKWKDHERWALLKDEWQALQQQNQKVSHALDYV